jgi:glycosyltransferase involved in cell wall biosynthesis
MSTYNKNEYLPNTLFSISRQKTSFPFEVCVADDGSTIDPEPIIKQFLPEAKYKRFNKRIGFETILSKALALADPLSDIVIAQSSDVVYLQPFIIEELCKNLKPHSIVMAEVKNVSVSLEMYKNFDIEVEKIFSNWGSCGRVYSGSKRPPSRGYTEYIFFLGSIFKSDLYSLGYDKCDCDCVVDYNLKLNKFSPIFLDNLKGIHQTHQRNRYPGCSFIKTCKISCRRKGYVGIKL